MRKENVNITDDKCITNKNGIDTSCITNKENKSKRGEFTHSGEKINLTKEEAQNYKYLKVEINMMYDELQRLDSERTRTTPLMKENESGLNTGGKEIYDRMAELTAMYVDAQNECLERIEELMELECKIKREFNKITNGKLKTLLYKRYIHNKSYRAIIIEMGLKNMSESSLRAVVARFWGNTNNS